MIAIFPVQKGPPSRRHVFLADSEGVTGITVWNQDVNKFPKEVLGGVVKIARASVSIYQGKKSLVLNKESHVELDTITRSPLAVWWESVALQTPLPLSAGIIASDNAIMNIFGVLAFITHESKEVPHTSHLAPHTSRLTPHASHLTHHTARTRRSTPRYHCHCSCHEFYSGERPRAPCHHGAYVRTDSKAAASWMGLRAQHCGSHLSVARSRHSGSPNQDDQLR